MHFQAIILLAALQDWLGLVVPIAVFVYAMIQLLLARAPQPPQRKPQRRPPGEVGERPLRPPPAQQKQGPQQQQLNAEIEQFLKRANQRRERPRRESEPPLKAPPRPAPRTIAPATRSSESKPPASPPPRELSTVADSVARHIGGRTFEQRAEHLADDITRADAAMEQHVKTSFTRKVGRLGDDAADAQVTPATDSAPATVNVAPATAMAEMLANPANVRQAFILTEILARPEHRW